MVGTRGDPIEARPSRELPWPWRETSSRPIFASIGDTAVEIWMIGPKGQKMTGSVREV